MDVFGSGDASGQKPPHAAVTNPTSVGLIFAKPPRKQSGRLRARPEPKFVRLRVDKLKRRQSSPSCFLDEEIAAPL
jgi:hypothetical protein